MKPTQVNHFTGRRKTLDDQRHVDIELTRENDGSNNIKNLAAPRDKSKNNDDELYVQVGEHT